jgi:hypothetical protein
MKYSAILSTGTWVIAALAAWGAVIFFSLTIQDLSVRVATMQNSVQTVRDQQANEVQTQALAKQISPARTALENTLQTDPLSLAGLIAQAGKDAGLPLHVSGASQDSASGVSTLPQGLHAASITFSLDATGAFSQLLQATALLESLPVPSTIDALDLRTSSDATHVASWQMNARVRILSTSQLSS